MIYFMCFSTTKKITQLDTSLQIDDEVIFLSDFMKCLVVILDDELIGKDCVISMRICYSWHKGYEKASGHFY